MLKTMPKILIIGYGNPLRSDDSLGWHAVRELSRSLESPSVEFLTCHQLTPELADKVAAAGAAIFIDALQIEESNPARPGELVVSQIVPSPGPSAFSHKLTPATLLDLGRQLYGSCPQAYAVSLCGESFAFGEALSPPVAKALPQLIQRVCDLVREAA
jgi:hydrogenase maturation protease